MEGNPKKAARILKRLYNIQQKQAKGENDDPDLIGQLGSAYWWQGKNEIALPLIKESVLRYEKRDGKNNPILIQPLINLAMAYFIMLGESSHQPMPISA